MIQRICICKWSLKDSHELHNGERQPFYNDKSGNSGIVRFSVPDTHKQYREDTIADEDSCTNRAVDDVWPNPASQIFSYTGFTALGLHLSL